MIDLDFINNLEIDDAVVRKSIKGANIGAASIAAGLSCRRGFIGEAVMTRHHEMLSRVWGALWDPVVSKTDFVVITKTLLKHGMDRRQFYIWLKNLDMTYADLVSLASESTRAEFETALTTRIESRLSLHLETLK